MLRTIIIIVLLIVFAAPLLSKAKDYWDAKSAQIKVLGDAAKKAIDYSDE